MKKSAAIAALLLMLTCLALSLSVSDIVTGQLAAGIGIIGALVSLRIYNTKPNNT